MSMRFSAIPWSAGGVIIAALGVVAVGCGGARLGPLKDAADADLNCPENRVHISKSGDKTRDVEGCGQKATYHFAEGEWRMIARSVLGGPSVTGAGQPVAPVNGGGAAQPADPARVNQTPSTPTGTPSQPPPSMPPPAPGQKNL